MVHADDIEYQFGFWAYCLKHPEARDDREHYPDAIALITGLDGGYHKSLFANWLHMSYAPKARGFNVLWLDLLDNWDHYDTLFRDKFIQRYKDVKTVVEDKSEHCLTSTQKENQKLLDVMQELNDDYLHLNIYE